MVIQRRLLCSNTYKQQQKQWCVKQVTKSNFLESLEEIMKHIESSDFVAVSLQKTGAFSAPWRRFMPFDTPDTAYLKAKDAAERFQLLQFAVCPFTVRGSKVVAYPYNFHLFPRDEWSLGMPSYNFSCQTSYLASMAREGFDFNVCIYDGISYLSRVQESAAKDRIGNPIHSSHLVHCPPTRTVADAVFVERVRSRVRNWRNALKDTSKGTNDALISSLRKLILGGETYGSRPCMNIDVCTELQVQLVLRMLKDFSDDLVPLIIPDKGGGFKAVRVVFTSSVEDKNLLDRELESLEEEQNKRVRGFREVIDAVSASQKPVVGYNCLSDFAFIHSKFLAPLPPSMNEFMCSLRLAFNRILDVNHLLKEIGPLKKATSLPAAISYLKRQFFVPLHLEIANQAQENEGQRHGHNVLRITNLFCKIGSILRITPDTLPTLDDNMASVLDGYANIFSSCSTNLQKPINGEYNILMDKRKVSTNDLVFLWGFRCGLSAGRMKSLLHGSHEVFSEEFEVRLVDKSCAVVLFWQPGLANVFLEGMRSGIFGSGVLREMIAEGLRAAGYETYRRVCCLGLWDTVLSDSLERVLVEHPDGLSASDFRSKSSEIYWSSGCMINLDDP